VIGGFGMALVEGLGGSDEIAAALEAPSLEAVTGQSGLAYRRFAEQTGSDRLALAACIWTVRETVTPEDLQRLAMPVLVAVGSKDTVAGSGAELAGLIPGAEYLEIPDRDHMLATGDKVFRAGVLDFLKRRP
jgi:pimeloyl-ACP methyl ester carboxylesterase